MKEHILIVEPENYSSHALDVYGKLGSVWLGNVPEEKQAQVTLIVVRLGYYLDEKFLSGFSSLTAIATPTTGLTHIDLDVCQRRNIHIFSLADCRQAIEKVTSTSELTIGLIISLLRQIPKAHYDVINNENWNRDRFRSRQLSRLTLGIIGLGRIGRHLAGYAHAFGMNVIAYDPYQSASNFTAANVKQQDLNVLLTESDIVSLNANLREDNHKLIGENELSKMRSGSFLINTARGALLDEDAAADALRAGKLGGVAVDVLAGEHTDARLKKSPLVAVARDGFNAIVTPHIAGCTSDAMHITEECLAEYVVKMVGSVHE